MTNTMTANNTQTIEETEKKTGKLSRKTKFIIFVTAFVAGSFLLCLMTGKIWPDSLSAKYSITNTLSDLVLGSIIGYFVFLRKRKSERT